MASGVRIEGDNVKIGAKAACFCDFIVTFAPNVGGAGPLSVAALPCSHAASASDHEDSNGMNQKIYNLEDFATQYHLSDIFGAYAAHLAVTAGEGATLVDMMAERTLIVVTDCDLYKLGEEQRTRLIALLDDFPEYCCLIFVYDLVEYKPNKTYKKLYAALSDKAQEVRFEPQDKSDLINWIARRFRATGHDIDARTAEHLMFTCGSLMTGLVPEIEKISAYAKGRTVTVEDINAVADPVLDAVVFDMTNAITKRDYGRASELLGQLLKKQEEPFVNAHIYTPNDYVGPLMDLCQTKRGVLVDMKYMDETRVDLHYLIPLGEIVYDFFDAIKSRSRGYASYDYEFKEYRESDLVKLDFLLNGDPVDALSMIVFRDNAYAKGRRICEKLRDNIPRNLFEIPVQAAIGGKIIARETVKAMRKDVLAKCYGGDISRKKKLLEKQKEGKKKMRQLGSVSLPSEAFTAVLKLDSDDD